MHAYVILAIGRPLGEFTRAFEIVNILINIYFILLPFPDYYNIDKEKN